MSIILFILSVLLLNSVILVNPALSKGVSTYWNPSHNLSLMYPSDWKIQFNEHNNTNSLLLNASSLGKDPNILKVTSIPPQNVSLFKYVVFEINKNIDSYAAKMFSSFSINDFTDGVHIGSTPAYCWEYFVIFSSDETQTPKSMLDCYVLNSVNSNIIELHFVQTGYGIDPSDRLAINDIMKSITFN